MKEVENRKILSKVSTLSNPIGINESLLTEHGFISRHRNDARPFRLTMDQVIVLRHKVIARRATFKEKGCS